MLPVYICLVDLSVLSIMAWCLDKDLPHVWVSYQFFIVLLILQITMVLESQQATCVFFSVSKDCRWILVREKYNLVFFTFILVITFYN